MGSNGESLVQIQRCPAAVMSLSLSQNARQSSSTYTHLICEVQNGCKV